jgi:hypothetical protein
MKKLFVLAVAAAVSMPAWAQAQYHRRHERDWEHSDRWDDRSERIRRVDRLIADAENRSDDFKNALRRALDHSRADGTYREHRMNAEARSLANAMDRMRDAWNNDRNLYRARTNLRSALLSGRSLQRQFGRFYLRSHVESEWSALRAELNRLAEVFEVDGI